MWPYQRLGTVQANGQSLLVAAAGSDLLLVNNAGKILHRWTSGEVVEKIQEDGERSAKRQKTELPTTIIDIAALPAHDHFLVVTEDKFIHVLKVDEKNELQELSRRCMPKRPCAVELIPHKQLILCADKFGDVYSLPLFPSEEEDAKYANGENQDQAKVAKNFTPSATPLTVHTGRNLKALESQKRQQNFQQRKGPLAFEHKVLLGHVSMLTDLAWVHHESAGSRILTADRDEHIRVSRPPPQAYVIEGFCLGHTEFISKICPIPWSTTLISGGGDDWLGVWDWTNYQLKNTIQVKQLLLARQIDIPDNGKLAVSSIQHFQLEKRSFIIAAFEKVKAYILIAVPSFEAQVVVTPAIPLAIGVHADRLIVSYDVRGTDSPRLQAWQLEPELNTTGMERGGYIEELNNTTTAEVDDATLDRSLYSIANLRKRGGWDETQAEEEE